MDEDSLWIRVLELARERPDWLPVLEAACDEARDVEPYGGRFAGRWVLQRVNELSGGPAWRPGLRLLVGYGLLVKDGDSTRGGRRAYYRMDNWRDVKSALARLRGRRLGNV
jgi:hypothetical protein